MFNPLLNSLFVILYIYILGIADLNEVSSVWQYFAFYLIKKSGIFQNRGADSVQKWYSKL
jgi:hypothetical protein